LKIAYTPTPIREKADYVEGYKVYVPAYTAYTTYTFFIVIMNKERG